MNIILNRKRNFVDVVRDFLIIMDYLADLWSYEGFYKGGVGGIELEGRLCDIGSRGWIDEFWK